jgi:hypothetical protein
MKFKFLKLAIISIIIATSFLANIANATLIDNGHYTTVNGIDWLDMSFTDNKSYNEVLTLIAAGQALDGWSVASFDDVRSMYGAFGFATTPDDTTGGYYATNTGFDDVLNMLGATYDSPSYAFTVGYVSDVGNNFYGQATWQRVVQTGYKVNSLNGYWRGDSWGSSQHDPAAQIGTYLMRTSVQVAEPSTLAIFALGMIGLASRRFKKQSRIY